jgi:hypothetical protein
VKKSTVIPAPAGSKGIVYLDEGLVYLDDLAFMIVCDDGLDDLDDEPAILWYTGGFDTAKAFVSPSGRVYTNDTTYPNLGMYLEREGLKLDSFE